MKNKAGAEVETVRAVLAATTEKHYKELISVQLFQHHKQLFRDWNFPAGGAGFRRSDDHLCMPVSAGNSADRPIDVQRAEFQVKIAPLQAADLTNAEYQFQP